MSPRILAAVIRSSVCSHCGRAPCFICCVRPHWLVFARIRCLFHLIAVRWTTFGLLRRSYSWIFIYQKCCAVISVQQHQVDAVQQLGKPRALHSKMCAWCSVKVSVQKEPFSFKLHFIRGQHPVKKPDDNNIRADVQQSLTTRNPLKCCIPKLKRIEAQFRFMKCHSV